MSATSVLARLPWFGWIVLVHGSVMFLLNRFCLTEPYMDEIFHISQAQAYCSGDFKAWDSKITTPPGLYIFSNLLLRPLSLLPSNATNSGVPWWCTAENLRWTNTILSTCTYLVLVSLFRTLHPGRTGAQAALSAFTLSWFPVLFSTGFLYYTDIGSTIAVLFAYLLGLRRMYWSSALVSLVALSFRQSNIIWTAFTMAACLSARYAEEPHTSKRYFDPLAAELGGPGAALKTAWSFVRTTLINISVSIPIILPYTLTFGAFAGFVVWNDGSIVLGDKANHQMALHIPQLFYFLMITTAFALPAIAVEDSIDSFGRFLRTRFTSFTRFIGFSLAIGAMLVSVHFCTIHHPFVLSDNRHYSFYVWKDVYRKHKAIPYALVPVYILAAWLCWRRIAIQQKALWCIAYITAVTLALVPSPLLEFRYFILPYIIYRIHIRQPTRLRLLGEALLYAVVNFATTYLFVWKPFLWPSEPRKLQRFMW